MKRIFTTFLICSIAVAILTGCGNKDTLSMSIEKIGDNVIYNESMVGVSGTLNKYFRPVVVFDNNDTNKMRYITNNLHTMNDVDIDVTIKKAAYYEAYQPVQEIEYARAVCVFIEFNSAEEAENARKVIDGNIFLDKNEDGTMNLGYCTISIRKNVMAIVIGYEENTMKELTRVFNSSNYVK